MIKVELTITNPDGLTPRLAAELVEEANKYDSDIKLNTTADSCDLKSIMNVFGTKVRKGDVINITAEGIDEDKAEEGFNKVIKYYKF